MKTISYLALVTAICIASQSANAQCVYRMIDVGRPHGYLSGPCNGHTLSYAGAYPNRTQAGADPRAQRPRQLARPLGASTVSDPKAAQ
jgi:hypothetical protein